MNPTAFSMMNIVPITTSIVSVFLSLLALSLSWANRRSQRSARLVAEILPEHDGVYLYVSNVGERIAYDVIVSIEPNNLSNPIEAASTIAPQKSFRVILCPHQDLPPQLIRVTMSYHDPQHKRRLVKHVGVFDARNMESLRVLRQNDSSCTTIEK